MLFQRDARAAIWQWEYRTNPARWVLTIGKWRAVVQRTEDPRYQWHAFIESTTASHRLHNGPKVKDPMTGRTWCLGRIAELRRGEQ
jgi:hypothetical protein